MNNARGADKKEKTKNKKQNANARRIIFIQTHTTLKINRSYRTEMNELKVTKLN